MTLTNAELRDDLKPFEFGNGRKASMAVLRRVLPDVETALFFAKAFKLDYRQLARLLRGLFKTTVIQALTNGGHSHSVDLQSYIIDTVPAVEIYSAKVTYDTSYHAEILPEMWDNIDLVIAKSVQEVADKVGSVIEMMPTKEATMVFKTLAKMNRQRPSVGVHVPVFQHRRDTSALVILDDSGSMTRETIDAILEDVIAMSWKANATLALVSNTTRVFEPGSYNAQTVHDTIQLGGTHYETLAPLFDRGQYWNTVMTVADYDSALSAKEALAGLSGRVGKLLDLSLVGKPTFLAECVGQLADSVEPMLVAVNDSVLLRGY